MTILSECVYFLQYSIFYVNCSAALEKNYSGMTFQATEILFLMIFYNFPVAIFKQPKKTSTNIHSRYLVS